MTTALLNVPECLDVKVFSLAAPRAITAPPAGWRRGWFATASNADSQCGTNAFRQSAARECVDNIAVLRAYREPLVNETWITPLASEQRLLAQVNAVIALGPQALTQVTERAIDADLPDPGRVFASLFVLGCVSGVVWLQPALDIFRVAVQRNPAEGAAAVEAMSLAPNVELLPGLYKMLRDDSAKIRSAAVRVLSFHAALAEPEWLAAMRDEDAAVVAAAAYAPLGGYDFASCERALGPLFHHPSERIARSTLHAGLGLHLRVAHQRALEISRSDPTWANALHFLAMFGFRSDEDVIRAALRGSKWPAAVRAAAVSGGPSLVPDLLALMKEAETAPEHRAEIGQALDTITGLSFAASEDPATASLSWTRTWAQSAKRFDSKQRYRHGQPFHPVVLLRSLQLSEGAVSGAFAQLREARQQAYLELVLTCGAGVPRFSAYDFVAEQSASLRRIEHWISTAVHSPWAATHLR
jgi:hypothetical protein